jgi:hypothetical protein
MRLSDQRTEPAKQSDTFRANAANCAELAEVAGNGPIFRRYKRMEAAWLALAEEQAWLDGERSPIEPARTISEIQAGQMMGHLPVGAVIGERLRTSWEWQV